FGHEVDERAHLLGRRAMRREDGIDGSARSFEFRQNSSQAPRLELLLNQPRWQHRQPCTRERGVEQRFLVVGSQATAHPDRDRLGSVAEIPLIGTQVVREVHAVVPRKLAWMPRYGVLVEIGSRAYDGSLDVSEPPHRDTLHAQWGNPDRDIEPLLGQGLAAVRQ